MPCAGALQRVAVNVDPASGSFIVIQTVAVESCFVIIEVAVTVGADGRTLTVIGIVIFVHLLVLSQTAMQTESRPVKLLLGIY